MEKLQWHTEKRKVKDLIPWDKNPRKLSEQAKKELTKSLEKFSVVEIPAINTDNKIIAGHQRTMLLMLQGKGEEEIDVRVPNRTLTDDEYKEYNLRSNKNVGEWDFDVLAFFEEDILKDVGFSSQELDRIFKDKNEDDFNGDKEAEKIVTPVSKRGEIYQLGRHRLMCGDSSNVEDVDKLMGGGPSRSCMDGSTLQRSLRRERQEYQQHNQKRRHGRGRLQSYAIGMVFQLQPPLKK